MKNVWSGDVDFGDGDLEKRHAEYMEYLKFVCSLGWNERESLECVEEDLNLQLAKLSDEKEFLTSAHREAKKAYDKLQKTPSTAESTMFASVWNLEEYGRLLSKNCSLMQSATSIIHIIKNGAIVIWLKDSYLAEAYRQLNNPNHYQKVPHDPTS